MDMTSFLIGFGLGVVSSGAYFMGLYMTIRISLRAQHPTARLAVSAVIRLGLFLTVGYFVARLGFESGLGFFIAFPLVRYTAIAWAGLRPDGLRGA